MVKEIYIVELVNGEDLKTITQAFENLHDAEEAFVKIIKEDFEDKNHPFTEYDIVDMLDDGYYQDNTHYSVIIKEIRLN